MPVPTKTHTHVSTGRRYRVGRTTVLDELDGPGVLPLLVSNSDRETDDRKGSVGFPALSSTEESRRPGPHCVLPRREGDTTNGRNVNLKIRLHCRPTAESTFRPKFYIEDVSEEGRNIRPFYGDPIPTTNGVGTPPSDLEQGRGPYPVLPSGVVLTAPLVGTTGGE